MSETENVCRLCLKIVPSKNCLPLDANFTEKLQLLQPDLKLTSPVNSVFCNICKESLEESHKLKRTCSSSNKLIRFLRNYLGIKHSVELKELIKGKNKKDENWPRNEHVCRICLKSNEGGYKSIKDAKTEFASILESCLSTLDENLTTNPLICKLCIDTLHKTCDFIKKFTDVENKVKSYYGKFPSETVDLFKVLKCDTENESHSCLQIEEEDEKHVPNEKIESRKRPSSVDFNDDSAKKQKIDSDSNDEEEDLVFESAYVEQDDPSNSSVAINELPFFDFSLGTVFAPYRRKIDIKDWTKQVEEMKAKMKWSDSTAKHKVLGAMTKMPRLRSWFSSVADVISWEEFKEKLTHAFANHDDYYFSILKMVNRTKRQDETYVEYYNEKLDRLKPLNFSEEQIMSCLLGGISDAFTNCIARIGHYKKREELLTFFKTCDEKKDMQYSKKKAGKANKLLNEHVKAPTQGKGESSMDCSPSAPKKNLIVLLEKNKFNVTSTKEHQKQNDESRKTSDQICSCCDQKGHLSVNCPLIMTDKTPHVIKTEQTEKAAMDRDQGNSNLIIVHENILISDEKSRKTENLSTADKKSPETVEKQSTHQKESKVQAPPKSDQLQKCACCDKEGHSSMDCPLIRDKVEVLQTKVEVLQTHRQENSAKKSNKNSDRGCQSNNLIVVHEDKSDSKPTEAKDKEDQNKGKCSYCDKLGHSSLVCPLIGSEGTSRRGNIKIVLDKDRLNKPPSNSPPVLVKDDLVCEMVQSKPPSTSKEGVGNQEKCSGCNKAGHRTIECPLIRPNKKPEEKQSQNNQLKCSGCNKGGHRTIECPLIRPNKKPEEKQIQNNQLKCSSCNKAGHRTIECPVIRPNKKPEEKQSQNNQLKCSGCNKAGHRTIECPLIRPNKKPEEKQIQNDQLKCSNCNKVGHLRMNCLLIRVSDGTENDEANKSPQKNKRLCLCCNQMGHSSLDCPLLGINKQNLLQQSGDKDNKYVPKNVNRASCSTVNTVRPEEKCSCCNKLGHATVNCPFYSFFHRNKYEAMDREKLQIAKKQQENPQQSTSQKRADADSANQKCCFCDKVGHSSIECFQIRFEEKHSQGNTSAATPSQLPKAVQYVSESSAQVLPEQNKGNQNVLTCEFCGRVGHRLSECFVARFDRNIYEAHHTAGNTTSRQCLYCGKFGHLQYDCPKNKTASKRATGFQRSRPGSSRH
ncbi:uncharacterized protein LOC108914780 [Anoplophora glabripennis]|uniref:uncharacterized protein LOC108914780 n=1 Tax=Anoplophora glabripennis TaxID=217634 RepID=UPI000875A205|nr:uncharacterized protein LOC108914780 [Anoplophora glabripennis]